MNSLSGIRRLNEVVIVTAVLAERSGACDSVQVLIADHSVGSAVRRLRKAGYRKVGTKLGNMSVDDESAQLAIKHVGQIFEREWLSRGEWLRVAGQMLGGGGTVEEAESD